MKNLKRATLLINLSVEDAEEIRTAAEKQDRTISAYVLRAVRRSLQLERQIEAQQHFPQQHRQTR